MSASLDLTVAARVDRDRFAHRTDVLDKVGVLRCLPDDMHATTDMVAEFYQVPVKTIQTVVQRNREELDDDGELLGLRDSVRELAALFGDINKYHDGRLVRSYIQIEYGLTTERIWHPDPAQDAVTRWDGHLLHDPGTPCPGKYVVTCDPDGQCVDVRVIRAVAS